MPAVAIFPTSVFILAGCCQLQSFSVKVTTPCAFSEGTGAGVIRVAINHPTFLVMGTTLAGACRVLTVLEENIFKKNVTFIDQSIDRLYKTKLHFLGIFEQLVHLHDLSMHHCSGDVGHWGVKCKN